MSNSLNLLGRGVGGKHINRKCLSCEIDLNCQLKPKIDWASVQIDSSYFGLYLTKGNTYTCCTALSMKNLFWKSYFVIMF